MATLAPPRPPAAPEPPRGRAADRLLRHARPPMAAAAEPAPATPAAKHAGKGIPQSVKLVAYPKAILLYPTLIGTVIAGIWMSFSPLEGGGTQLVAAAWLGLFTLNLVVLAFDFPRTASLTLFFLLFGVAMGLILLNTARPDWLPATFDVVKFVRPFANAAFYWTFAGILSGIFACVFLARRFDYWEVRPNELLHHHGFLSNLKRFSAPNLKIEKEINDVFEYALLRSGTLILHPKNEPRAIVLENVPGISKKEAQITRMLGALQVSVREQ